MFSVRIAQSARRRYAAKKLYLALREGNPKVTYGALMKNPLKIKRSAAFAILVILVVGFVGYIILQVQA